MVKDRERRIERVGKRNRKLEAEGSMKGEREIIAKLSGTA